MRPQWLRNTIIYMVVALAIIMVFYTFVSGPRNSGEKSISAVVKMAQQGQVDKIVLEGDNLTVTTRDGQTFTSRKEAGASVLELLRAAGVSTGDGAVDVQVKGTSGLSSIFTLLLNFLPLIFFGAVLLFMMRQAQGSNNQTLSFGRSRARMFVGNKPSVSFADVAGIDEAKVELQEVVEFLKYPERFVAMGARIPRGVLLVGPPGTGKTLLARAVAGEAGVPFFSISGSEFVEMFVGVGAARVRDLFDQAKRNAPCIVFVDEVDAVGRHRGAGLGGGHDEREQTLNQILVEMDGFDSSTNVIVMAATNRPDILDPALLRPGRFDRRVVLDLPDVVGREGILKVHSKGKPFAPDVDLMVVAKETPGFSGADLANLVNEAAILAARRTKKAITLDEFGEAIDRVLLGPERRSRIISHREKEITAYHEAGHALVGHLLPQADPVQKISIVARGMAGGYTRSVPPEDRHIMTKAQFKAMLAMALGGRVAEELAFNETTTGASNDLEMATHTARNMVTRYGMSETPQYVEIPVNEVVEKALAGKVDSIELYGNDLLVRMKNGSLFRSRKEDDFSLVEYLNEQHQMNHSGDDKAEIPPIYVKSAKMLGGLGPRTFGKREELIFLGREISEQRDYSDRTAEQIDQEVQELIQEAQETARHLLQEHKAKLVQLARHLITHETIEGPELQKLFESESPPVEAEPAPTPAS
ncbi:MAG: ATP-dependent zinc metalloprotease FtsH [Dehalococcoidia bacterium]|nr:ATP-dependent zinc metalloprotease FtsH [Dehalococcoidia bacterium]